MADAKSRSGPTTRPLSEAIHSDAITDIGIIDVGCGERPDPRATTTLDIRERFDPDLCVDIAETPWRDSDGRTIAADTAAGAVCDNVLEHVPPDPAMRELARIVAPGGWIEVRVPIGAAWADNPDHRHPWNWRSPLRYCRGRDFARTDPMELPLRLLSREYTSLWFVPWGLDKASPALRALARRAPGLRPDTWPCVAGELTARYEVVE